MRIQKVKVTKSGEVSIDWSVKAKAERWDEFSIRRSGDEPAPEFGKAMQALVEDVLLICELPDSCEAGMKVSGLSISWNEETGIWGAVITAQRSLATANSPLILNTPHLPSEPYSQQPGDTNPVLMGVTITRIETVMEEAEKYVKGHRRQMELSLK